MPSCLRSLIEKRRGMGGIIDTVRTAERQVRRGQRLASLEHRFTKGLAWDKSLVLFGCGSSKTKLIRRLASKLRPMLHLFCFNKYIKIYTCVVT